MKTEEIIINLECGQIAGKWWGSRHIRPIVLIHGWQDNVGTFDTLVPQLPSEFSYFAFDLPGHGHSYHLPVGLFYDYMHFVYLLSSIRGHFNWDRISIIGHSMGSIVAFVYAAIFPENVDLLIGLDTLKPIVRHPKINAQFMSLRGQGLLQCEERIRNANSNPPAYTQAELIERAVEGSRRSVNKDTAQYLIARGTKPSRKDPNKYYFSRDIRVRYITDLYVDQELCFELGKRIQVPHLYIKTDDLEFSDKPKNIYEMIKFLKKNNARFEMHRVKGTHHVHLNHPERVAGIISNFLLKYSSKSNDKNGKDDSDLLKSKL